MPDLDTLRPEVAQALGFIERNQKYGDGSVCAGDIDIIRAELLRLTDENARLVAANRDAMDHFEQMQAELAALKARMRPVARVENGEVRALMDPADEGKYVAVVVVEE